MFLKLNANNKAKINKLYLIKPSPFKDRGLLKNFVEKF